MAEEVRIIDIIELATFLESFPPGSEALVGDLNTLGSSWHFSTPDLQLYCPTEVCGGKRFFRCLDTPGYVTEETWKLVFLTYVCRNCRRSARTFALRALAEGKSSVSGTVYKIGEYPPFGPPVPSRVISLVGPDRELFLRGRRAENLGLGIGAYAYYRRVVENQWQHVLREIIRVAESLGAGKGVISKLENASKETQFSRAVDDVKDAIPQVLLIRNHNPLTLLHKALSERLHEGSEEECLTLAGDIRIVLTELAERISEALKDENEVRQALSHLLGRNEGQNEAPTPGEPPAEAQRPQQKL